ncbi:MAG: hypothetical protein ACR2LR_07000 [Hassallia sp.]
MRNVSTMVCGRDIPVERLYTNVILSGGDVFGIIARDYSIKSRDVPLERLYK